VNTEKTEDLSTISTSMTDKTLTRLMPLCWLYATKNQ